MKRKIRFCDDLAESQMSHVHSTCTKSASDATHYRCALQNPEALISIIMYVPWLVVCICHQEDIQQW